jgi:hypothetical protein
LSTSPARSADGGDQRGEVETADAGEQPFQGTQQAAAVLRTNSAVSDQRSTLQPASRATRPAAILLGSQTARPTTSDLCEEASD